MLKIPEYLLLTIGTKGQIPHYDIKVKVTFSGTEQVGVRYIDQESLDFIIHAFKTKKLHFMSFDEHPFRLKNISHSKTGMTITTEPILTSDNIDFHWKPSGLGYDAHRDLVLVAFTSKWNSNF